MYIFAHGISQSDPYNLSLGYHMVAADSYRNYIYRDVYMDNYVGFQGISICSAGIIHMRVGILQHIHRHQIYCRRGYTSHKVWNICR